MFAGHSGPGIIRSYSILQEFCPAAFQNSFPSKSLLSGHKNKMVKKATAAKHALCDRLLFIAFYIRKQGQCFNSAVKLQTPFKPYLSCFSSASFLPPFIIIFLPSLLLMLISRKAGYHSFVLLKTSQYIKFVQVFYYIFTFFCTF